MKKIRIFAVAVALCCLLTATATLTACGKKTGEVVRMINFGKYIDEELLLSFEEETGIHVEMTEVMDNEILYTTLTAAGANAYDVVVASDYLVERLITEDFLAPLDQDALTNAKNLSPIALNRSFDPQNTYCVPYMWGTLGLLYNTQKMSAPTGFDVLWDDTYKNQIIMMNSSRDAIAVAAMQAGFDANDLTDAALAAAKTKLIAQKPIIRAYLLDEVADTMIAEQAAVALVYSGEAATAMMENENLAYMTPAGTNLWVDGMVVPNNASNPTGAHTWINYLCQKENASANASEIGYFSPVEGVTEALIAAGELPDILPNEDQTAGMFSFSFAGDRTQAIDNAWTEAKS